jgi:hypothetical protein
MARADTETLMPLDTWAKIMQINPWEFNQVGTGFPKNSAAQCPHVFFQWSWIQDFLSREEVAQTIEMAEHLVASELGYYPAPKYFLDETLNYPRPAQRNLYGGAFDNRWQLKGAQLSWKKVQGGGVLARTAISLVGAVVLTDEDGDTVKETFTVTVPTTLTNSTEIGVYFKASDRNNNEIAETWRIRPVKVAFSGGNVVITGHSALLIVPDLTLRSDAQSLDVTLATNYVTEVEVYRVYRDDTVDTTAGTSKQGYAMWEAGPCDTPPCSMTTAPICLGERDSGLGFVRVDYSVGDTCKGYAPDRLSVSYLAGEPLVNGQMAPAMADIVAHLATAMLPVEKCGCDRSNRIIAYWREVGPAPGEGLRERLTGLGSHENPFGPQRGAIYAWNKVKRLRILA